MINEESSRRGKPAAFDFVQEGDDMRIEERIPAEIKKRLGYNNDYRRKKKHKKRHKRNERLTRQDIEELMGVNRPTYKRVRGVYRQR